MRRCARGLWWALVVALIGCSALAPARAADKVGVVLMHGKQGSADPAGLIGPLISELKAGGVLVEAPDMPWSRRRYLAKDYESSMREIDAAVARLKRHGATKIVVAGMSMGANAALGYGARRNGLSGIAAIAPGHLPELAGFQRLVNHDYRRAKALVGAGQGDVAGSFLDFDQGAPEPVSITARVYLSWFDPNGPAVIPRNTARLRPGTPLLWVVGKRDKMYGRGRDYAFAHAPANAKNAYVVVQGGHKQTAKVATREIVAWIKGL